jgi:hypothetical protein
LQNSRLWCGREFERKRRPLPCTDLTSTTLFESSTMLNRHVFFTLTTLRCAHNELVSRIEHALHVNGLHGRVSSRQVVLWANDQQLSSAQAIAVFGFLHLMQQINQQGFSQERRQALQAYLERNASLLTLLAPPGSDPKASSREVLVREFNQAAELLPTALDALALDWANELLGRMRFLSRQISLADAARGRFPVTFENQVGTSALIRARRLFQAEHERRLIPPSPNAQHQPLALSLYQEQPSLYTNRGVLLNEGLRTITATQVPRAVQHAAIQLAFIDFQERLNFAWKHLASAPKATTPRFTEFLEFFFGTVNKKALLAASLGSSLSPAHEQALTFKVQTLDWIAQMSEMLKSPSHFNLVVIQDQLEREIVKIQLLQARDIGSDRAAASVSFYRSAQTKLTELLSLVRGQLQARRVAQELSSVDAEYRRIASIDNNQTMLTARGWARIQNETDPALKKALAQQAFAMLTRELLTAWEMPAERWLNQRRAANFSDATDILLTDAGRALFHQSTGETLTPEQAHAVRLQAEVLDATGYVGMGATTWAGVTTNDLRAADSKIKALIERIDLMRDHPASHFDWLRDVQDRLEAAQIEVARELLLRGAADEPGSGR